MTEAERIVPSDWRSHLGVERDGITLRVCGEHFPQIVFLCKDRVAWNALDVTAWAQQGRPFVEAEAEARDVLIRWRDARRALSD